MTEFPCSYPGDREATLVSYLYDSLDPQERADFDGHLTACASCRLELEGLRDVRTDLAAWTPPFPSRLAAVATVPPPPRPASLWREMPAWAQAAAALLVVGVSIGVANLDVRYDRDGLRVRSGWMADRPAQAAATEASAPWRAELQAFERGVRAELSARAAQTPAPTAARPAAAQGDADLMRRVRALIEESERREQRELALRVAEVVRDVDSQRRSDLVKIDRNLGLIQNNTGAEVLRQRELLNYLVRTSQRQ